MTFVQTFFDMFKRKTIGLVKKVLFCEKMTFTPQPHPTFSSSLFTEVT